MHWQRCTSSLDRSGAVLKTGIVARNPRRSNSTRWVWAPGRSHVHEIRHVDALDVKVSTQEPEMLLHLVQPLVPLPS